MNLQKTLRSISIAALFLIPLFPLLVVNSYFFPFITGKAFYFRVLIELAFVSWAVLAFLDAKYRPRFTPLTIGVTIFAVVALVADVLGVNPVRSIWSNFERMEGWLVIVHLWGFYMISAHIFGTGEEAKRLWHRWLNVSLVVAVAVTIYALTQLFGWMAIHQGSSRLDASLGNAAYLAVYLLMHIGFVMYLFFVARARQISNAGFLQWAYPILAIIFSFIILETQTRGTIIGVVGGVMLALALYAILGKGQNTKSRWISAGVIGLIVVVGVIFWLNRNSAFVKSTPVLDRIGSISLSDTKTQARAYIWPMALKGFAERPILGWGQENFNYIFNANYEPKMWNQEQWFDRAHSVFLDWLVASGAVGLLAYLALYILALVAIWKSNLTIAQKSVLTGLVAGYAVHNIFVFDNLASYAFFFALLGFVGSLPRMKSSNARSAVSGPDLRMERKTFSVDAVEYVIMPIAIVALIAGLYFLNIRPIQANTRLISALTACGSRTGGADPTLFSKALSVSPMADQEVREQLLSCTGNVIGNPYPGPTKQAFFELATQEIHNQISTTPKDARIYVLGGMFLNNIGQVAQALPMLEKAHELTPGKQVVAIQLANLYLNANKKDEALALLKTAYEADPTYQEARDAYLLGLIIMDKETEAHRLFDPLPIFDTERVARAYLSTKKYDKAIVVYKKLIAGDGKNVGLRVGLSQAYYAAGMTWQAIETMRAIAADFPEYKAQVDEAIKEIQSPNK